VEGAAGSWELEIVRHGPRRVLSDRGSSGASEASGARLLYREGAEPPADLLNDLRERLSKLGSVRWRSSPRRISTGFQRTRVWIYSRA
jgi:hypothetical protein